ncbi:MAG TPA: hypothetical protein PLX69_05080 [Leptospiraceae bacterium]|nr:hypothetical protein [Leptospiraceae bacterium]HRG73913.1 hypothetical protein [Leptospiraceae bacterium]
METFNLSSFLLFGIVFGVGIYSLITLILKSKNTKPKSTLIAGNQAQDFSAFDSSDRFATNLSSKNIKEEEDVNLTEFTIKGDVNRLEEFLEKLSTLPNDSLDDIQISLSDEDDLFISIEKDEEKGITADVFFAEDLKISYEAWAPRIKDLIWEYQLESEEAKEDKNGYFSVFLGGKSLSSFADFIKKTIHTGYSEYAGKSLLIEFNHY